MELIAFTVPGYACHGHGHGQDNVFKHELQKSPALLPSCPEYVCILKPELRLRLRLNYYGIRPPGSKGESREMPPGELERQKIEKKNKEFTDKGAWPAR